MTQDLKDLLLQDLSARLPYGVKFKSENAERVYFIDTSDNEIYINGTHIEDVKLYLFPLSSLTSKQRTEIGKILTDTQKQYSPYGVVNTEGCDNLFICSVKQSNALINYCLSQHLDINGLIEKDSAIDATNLNIY